MTINATATWRVRPSGNNLNGGGYDAAISGAGTDYSQQNSAQVTGTNGAAAQNSTTFTDATANNFTSAMVGNAIWIASGTNFIVGAYFVTAFTNASTVTLDRAPATAGAGSVGVWKLGGAWADFWTNYVSTGPVVTGNTIFVLGSGKPNPASYTYDYVLSASKTVIGNTVAGFVIVANDPLTPGYKAPPDTTGGMPTVQVNFSTGSTGGGIVDTGLSFWQGIWFVASTNSVAADNLLKSNAGNTTLFGCVFDQFGKDVVCNWNTGAAFTVAFGSEFFSSVSASGGSSAAIFTSVTGNFNNTVIGCNIHDCVGIGYAFNAGGGRMLIANNIIAKNGSDGVKALATSNFLTINNNTIDGNAGNGINYSNVLINCDIAVFNNIISNHTSGSGQRVGAGNIALNTSQFVINDYNVYYNNSVDLNPIAYGPHDTHGGSNPYIGQSTENYTLA